MDPLVAAVTSVVVAGTPYFATTTPLGLLESSTVEHQVSFTGVFGTVVSHDAWATLNTAVRATEISSSMACALVGACDASPTGPARGAVQGKLDAPGSLSLAHENTPVFDWSAGEHLYAGRSYTVLVRVAGDFQPQIPTGHIRVFMPLVTS